MLKAHRAALRSAHFEGRVSWGKRVWAHFFPLDLIVRTFVKRDNFETITIWHALKLTQDIAALCVVYQLSFVLM
jgi:hypothetical protein